MTHNSGFSAAILSQFYSSNGEARHFLRAPHITTGFEQAVSIRWESFGRNKLLSREDQCFQSIKEEASAFRVPAA
jgi:hypothetical protein